MKDIFKDIFSNVDDWLKFAEAKNAALIVFNGASIFGAATFIATVMAQTQYTIPQIILDYLYLFIIFNGLGLATALYSFWPQTEVDNVLGKKIKNLSFKKPESRNNVLFYGHIKDYTPESYLAKLRESCNKEVGECSGLELDYATQIVINSRITYRKYYYFKAALVFTMLAVLTPIIFILLVLLFKAAGCLIKE